ncbi:unnamed protein product [Aphanomyces euteiches]
MGSPLGFSVRWWRHSTNSTTSNQSSPPHESTVGCHRLPGILQFSISPTCGVLLSLVVAATAVLALNQEQVNEPIAIEDSRALSAAFGGFRGDDEADVVEADETLRVLKATGRRRGVHGGFRGGFRGMGKRIGFGGGGFGGGGGGAEA